METAIRCRVLEIAVHHFRDVLRQHGLQLLAVDEHSELVIAVIVRDHFFGREVFVQMLFTASTYLDHFRVLIVYDSRQKAIR